MKNEKAKHTPGPWTNNGGGIDGKWEDGERVGVAMVGVTKFCGSETAGRKDKRMKAEDKANAALIAAAPELLTALERVIECHRLKISLDTNAGAVEQARAAIAKAKGE